MDTCTQNLFKALLAGTFIAPPHFRYPTFTRSTVRYCTTSGMGEQLVLG